MNIWLAISWEWFDSLPRHVWFGLLYWRMDQQSSWDTHLLPMAPCVTSFIDLNLAKKSSRCVVFLKIVLKGQIKECVRSCLDFVAEVKKPPFQGDVGKTSSRWPKKWYQTASLRQQKKCRQWIYCRKGNQVLSLISWWRATPSRWLWTSRYSLRELGG